MAQDHCAAWSARSPDDVAARYAENVTMIMNGGDAMTHRAEIAQMAAGFMADFPDLVLRLDGVLVAPGHMVYSWTFEGHHNRTGHLVGFSGWEEWDLEKDLKVTRSPDWFDAEDYGRQVSGG